MMKRTLGCLMAVCMIAAMLLGCSSNGADNTNTTGNGTGDSPVNTQETSPVPITISSETKNELHIVTTIFPIYDWVRQIIGENAENVTVTWLLDTGVDLHSYQATADDFIEIASCDMFIHVGGESDDWVHEALETVTNEDMVVLNLLEILGDAAKEEELKEGMIDDHGHEEEEAHEHEGEEGHEEEHAEEEAHEEEHAHEPVLDEHVWMSLRYAQTLSQRIAEEIDKLCDVTITELHRPSFYLDEDRIWFYGLGNNANARV